MVLGLIGSAIGAVGSFLGGRSSQKSQEKMMYEQIHAQKEFAKHGIRWKVDDAKAAGVHPLYALGAQTVPFSPIGIGSGAEGEGIGEAARTFGAGIERAVAAKQTDVERAYNAKVMQLSLQRGELENQLLASQIARINTPSQLPPALPGGPATAGLPRRFGGTVSGESPLVINMPMERVLDPAAPFKEPGAVADVSFANTQSGGLAPVPSQDAQDRMEDVFGPDIAWSWRNYVLPNINLGTPPGPAPQGYRWYWSYGDQSWKLRRPGQRGRIVGPKTRSRF